MTVLFVLTFKDIFLKVFEQFSQPGTVIHNKSGLSKFSRRFRHINFDLEISTKEVYKCYRAIPSCTKLIKGECYDGISG